MYKHICIIIIKDKVTNFGGHGISGRGKDGRNDVDPVFIYEVLKKIAAGKVEKAEGDGISG